MLDSIKDFLRSFKATYVINNLLHAQKLKHHKKLYRQYGLKKSIFSPISAKDFESMPNESPWLDQTDALSKLKKSNEFSSFSQKIQAKIRRWPEDGYMILEGFFTPSAVAEINKEVERLIAEKVVGFHPSGRIMFAYRQSTLLKEVVADPELLRLLGFLLGRPMDPFQSINFIKGSQQRPHSDSIHMSTYPVGYLAAIWIALEPIHEGNGPLVYYPGSHKLPYISNRDFNHGGNFFRIGSHANRNYEDAIADLIDRYKLKPETFYAKPGDLLIWHANLIHGGKAITQTGSTRKSMVIHYFAKDVICYHELTQRPALRPLNEVV